MSQTGEPLAARIAALIQAQGPISIAQYMTLALHDPRCGYYATRDPLGADFITAPEISQIFGELLGLWCVQLWHDQGKPKQCRLVELGPGRGTLMADALRAMRVAPEFKPQIVLVEASPVLRGIQQQNLPGFDIVWKSHFDETLGDAPLFLLANEFFDALPIRQYVRTAQGWHERMVVSKDGTLSFALAPGATPPALVPADRADAPEGGVYESSAAATALAQEIARIIAAQGGGALVLDYGYGEAAGFGETLQAVGANDFAQVLSQPGAHDLSAHVDFAALGEAGRRGGATIFGPRGQGAFLSSMGLAQRAGQLAEAHPDQAAQLIAGARRLIDPVQMGTLFQALAFVPSGVTPPGF
jgi:SAM-dependent MidA family methyltransferase